MEYGRSLSALTVSKSFRAVMIKLCEYGVAAIGLTGWQYVAIGSISTEKPYIMHGSFVYEIYYEIYNAASFLSLSRSLILVFGV